MTATQELQDLLAELRRDLADEWARWVRPENWHLTVEFFGAVEKGRIGEIVPALAKAAGESRAFDLRIGGLGTFGSRRHPRVLWLGVESAGLHLLHDRVGAALREAGWTPEARVYSPHLTLARFARVKDARRIGEVVERYREAPVHAQRVETLRLYESHGGAGGPRYLTAGEWALEELRGGLES